METITQENLFHLSINKYLKINFLFIKKRMGLVGLQRILELTRLVAQVFLNQLQPWFSSFFEPGNYDLKGKMSIKLRYITWSKSFHICPSSRYFLICDKKNRYFFSEMLVNELSSNLLIQNKLANNYIKNTKCWVIIHLLFDFYILPCYHY